MADGIFYADTKPPFTQADYPTITLLTTSLMLYPAIKDTAVGQNYFWPGKKFQVEAFGKMTTALTPGNLTLEVRLTTTDAGGVLIGSSAATALAASKTNIPWRWVVNVHCRAAGGGTTGSLFCSGSFIYDGAAALFTTTAQNPLLMNGVAGAAAAVGVDTTTVSGISLQMKRSGSTVETATVNELIPQALN